MGLRTTYFSKSLKRVAALASVLGAISGIAVTTASAQNAQNRSLDQAVQQVGYGQDFIFQPSQLPSAASVTRIANRAYAPTQVQNSARIVRSQPVFFPPARQQATINRRALVGQGRMVSAGFRQEPGVLGSLPGKQDDPQDFFGDKQAVPTVPRNDTSFIPKPSMPQPSRLQNGELPPDVFKDPFQKERRPKAGMKTVEIPGEITRETPDDREDPPKDKSGGDASMEPETQPGVNPFVPKAKEINQNNDNQIDYKPGRGLNITRSRSNVYRAPDSEVPSARDRRSEPDNGVYFVPAYDPIPGTQQSTLAPPATITPEYQRYQQPAWQNQYAAPQQPGYEQPRYEQPSYEQPRYEQPRYEQPRYEQPRYEQPQQYTQQPAQQPLQYTQQPQQHAQQPPQQQVYSSVVGPAASLPSTSKGPITQVRLSLWGKMQRDLKNDWGFGDYESCQGSGDCGGCDSDFGSLGDSKCPVFYVGFQGAWNDAFDISNDLGSELVLDDGSAFFFSLGRMNGRNLRTELELSFRDNEISSLITPTAELLPVSGQLRTFSGMANLYWEFVNFPTGRLKPYVGAGAGFLSVSSDLRLASAPSSSSDQSGTSSSFAYQLMAGVNFKVSNHLDLYGEYRFVDADSIGISSDRNDLSGDFSYSANSIGGGFRWKF